MKTIEYWWSYDTHKIGSILPIFIVFWDQSRSFQIAYLKNWSPWAPVTTCLIFRHSRLRGLFHRLQSHLCPLLDRVSFNQQIICVSHLPHRHPQLHQPSSFQIPTTTAAKSHIRTRLWYSSKLINEMPERVEWNYSNWLLTLTGAGILSSIKPRSSGAASINLLACLAPSHPSTWAVNRFHLNRFHCVR